MMITDAYARIICTECKKQVDILTPGKPFKTVKECDCGKAKPRTAKRTNSKSESK